MTERIGAPILLVLKRLCLVTPFFLASLAPRIALGATPTIETDVVIVCEPTLRPVLEQMAVRWRHENGGSLRLFSSPTQLALDQAGYGARADVIFGSGDAAARAGLNSGQITSDDLIGRWKDSLVLATLHPRASGKAEMTQADILELLVPSRVAMIVETLSPQSLDALGLTNASFDHAITAASSPDAMSLLEDGSVTYAIIYSTDLASNRAMGLVSSLAADRFAPAIVWAGQARQGHQPAVARFADFLREPGTEALLTASGLEKISQ